jgi:hypothetical protein
MISFPSKDPFPGFVLPCVRTALGAGDGRDIGEGLVGFAAVLEDGAGAASGVTPWAESHWFASTIVLNFLCVAPGKPFTWVSQSSLFKRSG